MLDLHIRQGYTEKYTPFMVKSDVLFASGQLPKFRDNLYHDAEEDFWMVPTAEVPLTGIHMGEFLEESALPLNYTAYTPCFRREKMSAGRDVRGIKRGHQFDKVEMYKYCKPEESMQELQNMIDDAGQTCAESWFALPEDPTMHRRPGFQRSLSLTTSRSGLPAATSGSKYPPYPM